MKSKYEAPVAVKLEFDYSSAVTASGVSGSNPDPGDWGNGNGCNRIPSQHGQCKQAEGY